MNKRLLIIVSSFGIGGAEKQTVSLINHLEGFRIHVLSITAANNLIDEVNSGALASLQYLDKHSRFDIFSILLRVNKLVKAIRPDIIYCVNLYPTIFAYLNKKMKHSDCKLVVSIHTTLFKNAYNNLVFRWIYKPVLKRFDHIVYVSEQQKRYWQTIYGVRYTEASVIHNGIDLTKFKTFLLSQADRQLLGNKFGLDKDDLVLCMCTALRPEKNHLLAVSAVRRLVNEGVPAKLLIVGDGPMRGQIEKAIVEYGVKNRVILAGVQQNVRPYLALSDAFLLTSSSVETFSIAILEAMAMGKPIIAPNIGGLGEQVFHGVNGFLFEINNESQLVHYIKELYKKQLIGSMGSNSVRIVKQFDAVLMARKYEQLFSRVLKGELAS